MHYTPKFLAAMERVRSALESGQHTLQFIKEMKELGWKERIRNLYRIKDKSTGEFVFFTPNSCQEAYMEERSGRDEILKSRQIGFSTWSCIYAYDRSLWDDWSTGIMSHLREKTGLIFEMIKNANDWFKKDWGMFYVPEQEQDSANRIVWKHSKASITVSYDFRGLTCRFLHISEAAFIEPERLTSSLQSVPEEGEIILESTPQGCGGFFYQQWQLFKREGSTAPFKGFFFPWFKHYPENPSKWENRSIKLSTHEQEIKEMYDLQDYHLAWRRWKIQESCEGDEQIFEVEYPSDDVACFLSGSNQVFPNTALKLQDRFVTAPAFLGRLQAEGKKISFYEDKKGLLEVWEMPKAGNLYAIGADIAEGVGKDFSVAVVINKSNGEQVAMFRGYVAPDDYIGILWNLGYFYNYAYICPEVNSFGLGVVTGLVRKGYSKLYKRTEQDDISNVKTKRVGFRTTTNSKPTLINSFVSACKEGKFKTKSKVLLEEMSSFIQVASKTGRSMKMQARAECHDDCVMAAAMAWEMASSISDAQDVEFIIPDSMYVDGETGFLMPNEGWEMQWQ